MTPIKYINIKYKKQETVSSDSKEKKILSAQWGTVQIRNLQKTSLCEARVKKVKCWKPTKERPDGVGWRGLSTQITGMPPAATANCLDYTVSPYADRLPASWAQNWQSLLGRLQTFRRRRERESFHLIWIIRLVLPTYKLGKKLKLFWSKRWRITWI